MRFSRFNFLLFVSGISFFDWCWAVDEEITHDFLEKLKITINDAQDYEDLLEITHEVDGSNFNNKETKINSLSDLPGLSTCEIRVRDDIKSPQPVFLKTNTSEFYPYSDNGLMLFKSGDTMEMLCTGKFEKFPVNLLTATCVNGTRFRFNGTVYDLGMFTCRMWPIYLARRTGIPCNGWGTLVSVGFNISKKRFAELMRVCFNEEEEVTRYVVHSLDPGNNYYQTNIERLTFQTGDFFYKSGKNVDKLYTQVEQQQIVDGLLGGGVADQYFNVSTNLYLARGHIAAKTDFVYGTQQRATFLFINAAPQWQAFNAGNWARIENSLRTWVAKRGIRVECYSGVWGISTLPNTQGIETPLYLSNDENNNGLIPVPKLYFRVVIEPATKRGIVFVGVNNPHLTLEQIQQGYIICNDVSDLVTYISWKKDDIRAGYSYACQVEEFLETVDHLPPLNAQGGLLI